MLSVALSDHICLCAVSCRVRAAQIAPSTVQSTEDYMRRAQQRVNLHPVQTIGQEMICAGKTAGGALVLVHTKLKPGRLDIIVKAPDNGSAQVVVPVLKKEMS